MVRFNQTLAEDSQHLPYKTHRLQYFSPPKIHKRRRRAERVTQTGNIMLRTRRSDLRFQKTGIVANPNALASGQRWQPFRLQPWRCLLPGGRNSAYSLLFFLVRGCLPQLFCVPQWYLVSFVTKVTVSQKQISNPLPGFQDEEHLH